MIPVRQALLGAACVNGGVNLHTMALAAIRQGDVRTGRSLLQDAIATHPQHFDAAVNALAALQ